MPKRPRDDYDNVKNLCFAEIARLTSYLSCWIVVAIVSLAFLIADLAIYQAQSSVIIVLIINGITGSSASAP